MNWTVQPATDADAVLLAPRMRAADAAEVWASAHMDPLDGLRHSIAASTVAYTWIIEGVPGCVYGVSSYWSVGGSGNPWLLTSDLVDRHRMTFLRHYRAYLVEIQAVWPVLETWVDARHQVCLRWLAWLGFEIGEPVPFGMDGLPFVPVKLEVN